MSLEPTYSDHDQELDIDPFKKFNWKTKQSRDKWYDDLNACRDAYPLVEIAAVAFDDLDRSVTTFDRSKLRDPDYANTISEYGLTVVTRHSHAAVCSDEGVGEAALDALTEGRDRDLGELEGYPECCLNAHEGVEDHLTPIYEIACRSDNAVARDEDNQEVLLEDPNPLLNVIWQYLGYTFISHTPCSFDCEESIEIAQAHGKLYRELGYGDEAEALWEFLGTPTTWTGYHGLSNILNGYLIGSTNTPEYWDKKTVVWKEDHAEKLL